MATHSLMKYFPILRHSLFYVDFKIFWWEIIKFQDNYVRKMILIMQNFRLNWKPKVCRQQLFNSSAKENFVLSSNFITLIYIFGIIQNNWNLKLFYFESIPSKSLKIPVDAFYFVINFCLQQLTIKLNVNYIQILHAHS